MTDIVISLLAEDNDIIPYRKSLRPLTNSVTATILLQQMIYRSKAGTRKFYKFKAPCNHDLYKPGDSWTEELGFSVKEFDCALKKIGTKIRTGMSKADVKKGETANCLILYWTGRDRVTHYEFNRDLLSKLLKGIYVSPQREFASSTPKGNPPLTEKAENTRENSGKPQKSPKQQKQKPVTPPVPEDDTPELDDFFEPSLSPPRPPHKSLSPMEMLMGGVALTAKSQQARQLLARSGKKCYGPYKENMETVIVNFLAITGYQVPTGDGAWGKWTKGAKEISRCYKIDDIPDLMRKAYHKLKEGDMPTSHPLALNNTMQAIWQEKQAGKSSTPNLTPAGLAAYKKMQEAEAGGR